MSACMQRMLFCPFAGRSPCLRFIPAVLAPLQEWTQLRRSFRYDEYNKIAQVNPPQGPLGKVSTQQQWVSW
jgi:hypothetical protein